MSGEINFGTLANTKYDEFYLYGSITSNSDTCQMESRMEAVSEKDFSQAAEATTGGFCLCKIV